MGKTRTIARRSFLIGSAAIVGGAAFGVYKVKRDPGNPLKPLAGQTALNPYILIDASGVTIIAPRAEMGQGVHSTLAALVAEELDVAWADIKVEHGPAGKAYSNQGVIDWALPVKNFKGAGGALKALTSAIDDVPIALGLQITGGSSSVPDGYVKMRLAGAAARMALIEAAAKQWGLEPAALKTNEGQVIAPDGAAFSYSDLAPFTVGIELPQDPALKPQAEWRYLGKSMPRVDIPAKSTGTATFGIDTRFEGMLYASVKMNPRLGGRMISFDASAAKSMQGVEKVIDLGTGVAVVASNTWFAFQALEAISCDWGDAPYPAETHEIFDSIRAALDAKPNSKFRNEGDTVSTIEAADPNDMVEAEYSVPFLAHATMEPMNATALFEGDAMTLWVGNQFPTFVRDKAAKAVGLSSDQVDVITPFLGGGFGRRVEFDVAVLAARIAKEIPGRAIKTTWTREEDMTHDFYRPGAVARFRGVMTNDGPAAFEARIAAPSVTKNAVKRFTGISVPGPDSILVEGAFNQPYNIPNYRVTGHVAKTEIPLGIWRSVGNSMNGFFHESFMDELAHAKGLDPIKMRLALMKDQHLPSFKVLEKVAAMAGWTGKTAHNIGRGVGFTYSFGAPTAEIVEVHNTDEGIRIAKVWAATDVGIALDPRNIEAQVISGAIFGLSAAMMGEITFLDSEVEQRNFPDYDALRMHNVPEFEVAVLENKERITGIGEPGTPPAMPALANALFDLTGTRARSLPLNRHFDFV